MTKLRRTTWLIVMVFAIRALVPNGFMLSSVAATDGLLTVVVCTSSGPKLIAIGSDGHPVEHRDHGKAVPDCPYGPMPAVTLSDHPIKLATERSSSSIERTRQLEFVLARRYREFSQAREPPFGV